MAPWLKEYLSILKQYYPQIQTDNIKTTFIPRWKVSLEKCEEIAPSNGLTDDIYFSKGVKDTFVDATLLEVTKNERTTAETHFQASFRISLNLIIELHFCCGVFLSYFKREVFPYH